MKAKAWFNPGLKKHVATPSEGPFANELYGMGANDEDALNNLLEDLKRRAQAGDPQAQWYEKHGTGLP